MWFVRLSYIGELDSIQYTIHMYLVHKSIGKKFNSHRCDLWIYVYKNAWAALYAKEYYIVVYIYEWVCSRRSYYSL